MFSANPMFEVNETMASKLKVYVENSPFLFKFFNLLNEIITQLVVVKPENRMKLEDARFKLEELHQVTKSTGYNFLLLNAFLQDENDPVLQNIDENSLNSLMFLNEIRSTSYFSFLTTEEDKNLGQRLAYLIDSVTAMRLLSYALVEFLENHFTGDNKALKELTYKILKYPAIPESPKYTPEEREALKTPEFERSTSNNPDGFNKGLNPVKREPFFIHKLLTICCGVISPRSLNENNNNLAPDRNIRKLFRNKLI